MNTSEQVLVIIISSLLGLFLILSIMLIVMAIRLVRHLRNVAQKAENIVNSAETVSEMFRKSSVPLSFLRFVNGVAETVTQRKEKHKEK